MDDEKKPRYPKDKYSDRSLPELPETILDDFSDTEDPCDPISKPDLLAFFGSIKYLPKGHLKVLFEDLDDEDDV